MISAHVSIAGWEAILARFAPLIRPQVETLGVVLRGREIDLVGTGTSASIELDMDRTLPSGECHNYMVAGVRLGSGGMPSSIAACQIHGLEIIEIGRIGALAKMVLGRIRIYTTDDVPCRSCDGNGSHGHVCHNCKGAKLEPAPNAVPWCQLPGWGEKTDG